MARARCMRMLHVQGAGKESPTRGACPSNMGVPPATKARHQLMAPPEEAQESPFKRLPELFSDIIQRYWVRLPGTD